MEKEKNCKKIINYLEMGTRIRKQREALSYSREQLAEKLSVSTKFCADIETGIKGMSLQTLAKLSQILHISTDYIIFGNTLYNNDPGNISEMLRTCPKDKTEYAEEMLKIFIRALDK